jgi:multidrug efflux system outer membrane protein
MWFRLRSSIRKTSATAEEARQSGSRRFVEQPGGRLARELYLAGLGDFLSVLEAQRSQFAAEEALQHGETALRQHLVALYEAASGGWEAISGAGRR